MRENNKSLCMSFVRPEGLVFSENSTGGGVKIHAF